MEKKICSKCGVEKGVCDFYVDVTKKDGLYPCCKLCKKKYLITKTSDTKTYSNSWRLKNPNYMKDYYKKNPNYIKEYYRNNKDILLIRVKEHYKNNKEKYLEKIKKRNKKYIEENNLYRLSCTIRSRLRAFLKTKKIKKHNKTFDIIGCSPEFLKEHIEKKFTDGMNWDLMGKHIHIDHIIPLSSAKTEEEMYKLCHYTNLQPLWAQDNLKKSNKIIY